eukprot:9423273-Pyramimonas_sp.AAC.2
MSGEKAREPAGKTTTQRHCVQTCGCPCSGTGVPRGGSRAAAPFLSRSIALACSRSLRGRRGSTRRAVVAAL